MRYYVSLDGRSHVVETGAGGVSVDGRPVEAHIAPTGGGRSVSALIDGRSLTLVAGRTGAGEWSLLLDGRPVDVEVVDERTRHVREMTGAGARVRGPRAVRAPMPGMIVRVEVGLGQEVRAGDGLVIVEAMKMENELRAEADGTVKAVLVETGEAVEKDQVLIEFEAPGGGESPDD